MASIFHNGGPVKVKIGNMQFMADRVDVTSRRESYEIGLGPLTQTEITVTTYGHVNPQQSEESTKLLIIADWIEEQGDPYGWAADLRKLSKNV